jgi:dihydroorotate dehydrogenase
MTHSSYRLAEHEIATPLINAAGSINGTNEELILDEVELLARTAIGAITVGSFTVPRQAGNEARFGVPVYYHDQASGATYNAMGLPNIGLETAKRLMPEILMRAHDGGKPVIASVSPTLHTPEIGDPILQVQKLVYELQLAGADLIEVNTSCPNIVAADGSRKPILGYDLEAMQKLVTELAPWTGVQDSKVGVKLPPYISDAEKAIMPGLAGLFKEQRVFGFVTTANTIPNQVPKDERGMPILSVPGGVGGLSGPATKARGREQLRMWHELLGDEIDIISTLGFDGGEELAFRVRNGAAAAAGVTFLWESNNWGRTISEVISDWADAA